MDEQRFDALARVFAAPGSRRQALRVLVGSALAGLALTRRPGAAAAVQSDPDQCGIQVGLGCGGGSTCCTYLTGVFAGCCPSGGACCTFDDGSLGGAVTCCGANQTFCDANGRCSTPPSCADGTTPCGTTCCTADETCDASGQCVAAPPPPPPPPPDPCEGVTSEAARRGRRGRRGRVTVEAAVCCPKGRAACGSTCCARGQECSYPGDANTSPVCCKKGKSCGLTCAQKGVVDCCNPTGVGDVCTDGATCCGSTTELLCCTAEQKCVHNFDPNLLGTCLPR